MKRQAPRITDSVELVAAPAAIQRALDVYEQLLPHDPSVVLQAKKILTQHIYGMVDQGEHGAVAGLVGIECGVVSGVINLESSGVEASDWRPRHDEHYHEA